MKANKKKAYLDIYSGSPWEAKHLMNLLKEANLSAYVKEDITKKSAAKPVMHIEEFTMKIFVSQEQYVNALKIVSDYTSKN